MELLTRENTIYRINDYATRKIPFVFLISYKGEDNLVYTPGAAANRGFFVDMPGMANHSLSGVPGHPIHLEMEPPEPERYRNAFDHVIKQILHGNSFLLNLTLPSLVKTNYSLRDIFTGSNAPFKLYLKDKLVVFSPERFVRIRGCTIVSNPMKGTLDASIPEAYRLLSSDPKEDAEHNTIVDLIRNDLSRVATHVRVKRFKYIEKLRTNRGELLQMSSEISGMLPSNFRESLGEIIFSMLPAGSITGAPKQKTMEIIKQVEGYDRGYYTGIFGYYDGESLDSAVAIRYMEQDGKQLVFKSGGGITFRSEWRKEYEELQKKVYVPVF